MRNCAGSTFRWLQRTCPGLAVDWLWVVRRLDGEVIQTLSDLGYDLGWDGRMGRTKLLKLPP